VKKYFVLGGYGIIGKAVVDDLFRYSKKDIIIIAGRDEDKARNFAKSFNSKRVKYQKVDISNEKELVDSLIGKDICINCVQYYFNLTIMESCIKAKTNYVDLGGMFHMTKKQLGLCKEFIKIGKCAIIGMGGAPGLSNVLASYAGDKLTKINTIDIVFADVDYTKYSQSFVLPYSFKTLVEEFTLNPAIFREGKIRFVEPRSGVKEYNFGKEFGKQTGFLTLHSEIATLPDYFRKKGIKRCEFRVTFDESFIEKLDLLISLGFSSNKSVEFGKKETKIIDSTTKIMDKLVPNRGVNIKDKEIIRVILNGNKIVDAVTQSNGKMSAGVLDTGIPCSIASQIIINGKVYKSGVFAPEDAINPTIFFKELKKRNIIIRENGRTIN